MGAAELLDFGCVELCARFRRDVGDGDLAGMPVGSADRRGEGHAVKLVKDLLDDGGVYIVAAPYYEIFFSAGEPEILVLIEAAEVAGVEPVALHPCALVMGLVLVPLEHIGASNDDHANLVRIAVADVFALFVEDDGLELLVRNPQADGADLADAVAGVVRGNDGRLGETVALEQLEAGALLEGPKYLHR